MKRLPILLLAAFVAGCIGKPEGVEPVSGFVLDRYLGTWHEIARLDHSFERGLTRVSATYSLREDGGVKVLNRGYSPGKKSWQEAEGRAYFVDKTDVGFLKVSFFGPFYGSYVVFDLDQEGYRHALVCGPDKSYLWILAREPKLDRKDLDTLLARAAASGFETNKLIFVEQE